MVTRNVLPILLLVILLSACNSPISENAIESTATKPPTDTMMPPTNTTSPPTNTVIPSTKTSIPATETVALPTDTPVPTFTPLPEGMIFRDDFSSPLMDGWHWDNENPNRWSFDDGWLIIIAEDPGILGENSQSNFLWRELPAGDFAIIVHVDADTRNDFQQAAIFIYEDSKNYVTINRGYCSPCEAGGNGIYMDYKIGGAWGNYHVPVNQSDVYLKLESKNKQIHGYYALEADQWQHLGVVGNYFEFTRVSLGASNCDNGTHDDDLLARFDYFEIIQP